DEALPVIRKLFSGIPKGKLPPRKAEPAEARLPARLTMKSKFSQPRLLWAVKTVKSGDADHAALAVLEKILSQGKRSRLYRALVEGAAIASNVDTEYSPGRFPGWLGIFVDLLPGQKLDNAERLLLVELAKLSEKPPSEAELKRVKRQM